ncbi:alpha/beta hydrolase [Deinococcus sp. QL22]|uniref:alpha/beta hydrolase n=1 Tax=Deinococcus sp. QL22 TaxID=2939437 RepID=UPI00201771A7|nr:alpha/beta fold hydrolase [Deinococcus sp. QL22]UQN07961.1 lysophospholipase [Deinococcus sp. QL22]
MAAATFRSADEPEAYVLFLHPWTSWKDERDYAHVKLARDLAQALSVEAVLFDHRGHGESTGSSANVTMSDFVADVQHVQQWLQQRSGSKATIVVASGVAAVTAASVASLINAQALVLLSPSLHVPPRLLDLAARTQSVRELLKFAERENDLAYVRSALQRLGVLPDHTLGELFNPAFLFGVPDPLSYLGLPPTLVVTDGESPSYDVHLLASCALRIADIRGGGLSFRHPDCLSAVSTAMLQFFQSLRFAGDLI